jgi:serine O-acetyltransferase
MLRNTPLWAIILYRYGRWVYTECEIPIIKTISKIIYNLLFVPTSLLLGIFIPWSADIGEGLYIGHYGSIWIGPIKMGKHCNISQEVTIGIGRFGGSRGVPKIGDRVYIAPGAKIFGKIRIGNDVAIGANSVVSKNIPDRAVVVGNPGRIVGFNGSEGMIDINDEEYDKFN